MALIKFTQKEKGNGGSKNENKSPPKTLNMYGEKVQQKLPLTKQIKRMKFSEGWHLKK